MIDIICVTYGQNEILKCFINSIKSQTDNRWRLFIIHDGINTELKIDLEKNNYLVKDKILFIEYPERTQNYGHLLRNWGLKNLVTSEYVMITNGDNYYTPNMVKEVLSRHEDFIYFNCIHSHKTKNNNNQTDYGFLDAKLVRGWIDIGSAVLKSSIAKKVGFNSVEFHADWVFFEQVFKLKPTTFKINKTLFVHN
jgi:hypothetical protein